MLKRAIVIFLMLLLACVMPEKLFCQYQNTFTVRFLKAKLTQSSPSKKAVLVFHISVADTANYPPRFHLPPKCSIIVNGLAQIVPMSQESFSLSLYDDRIIIQNVQVYDMIRDKIDLQDKNKMIIMVFTLDLTGTASFKKMMFTFALSEKRNAKQRWKKKFEFDLEE
ncbi:MAG: hypothetical protein MUF75_09405 [Bacteroidia bacterium]|jgi:hypothetical protein|nr:hypothetical protein [Bacteroidia bacterium]